MSAPGTYGPEHAVNAVDLRREAVDPLDVVRDLIRAGLENCEDVRAHLGKSEEWATGFRMALSGLAEGLPS